MNITRSKRSTNIGSSVYRTKNIFAKNAAELVRPGTSQALLLYVVQDIHNFGYLW